MSYPWRTPSHCDARRQLLSGKGDGSPLVAFSLGTHRIFLAADDAGSVGERRISGGENRALYMVVSAGVCYEAIGVLLATRVREQTYGGQPTLGCYFKRERSSEFARLIRVFR